ncbi:MAG: hypothetical protein M9928_11640 [Anaerolineae bacterium]|nr:hypothetical protein [Anaerolineae bacterium]MCO5188728.1 hypothetical protein [Anaerolineae bacterium]MCO5197458.1 hypothetical protein [Anaerolineae bacterium]MCO5205678.1 hypothetical protein [Anaerolineae bacterium]
MQFKVKDLAIGVSAHKLIDLDKLCLFPTRRCRYFITTIHCKPCTWIPSIIQCDPCTLLITEIPITDGPCGLAHTTCLDTLLYVLDVRQLVINPDDLGLVREQMDKFFNVVTERGAEVARAMAPQTLEQVDLVESELKAALEEIQVLRDRLQ